MKWLNGLGEHGDLYRIGAAFLASILLVALFILTQPVNQQNHNALQSYLSQIQSDEAKLSETVLELNFSLSNNYDKVNTIFERMLEAMRLLKEGEAASNLQKDSEFQNKLHLLEENLSVQSEVLEQFKSSNAVLKNSLIYLPHARDDIELDLPSGTELHEQLDDLVENVFMIRISGGLIDLSEFNNSVAIFQKNTERLPVRLRQKIIQLMNHIHHIEHITLEMPSLVQQLSGNKESSELAESYRNYYDRQQKRAGVYRIFLLLATLALLTYVIQVLIRLRQQAIKLRLAASVFASASDGIMITDTKGNILETNPAFTEVTDYTREEVLGKNPRLLQSGRQDKEFYWEMWQKINETGQWQGEIWNRRKSGMEYPEWLTIAAVKDTNGKVTNYVGTFSDITLNKAAEDEIKHLAFYDPLSGLPNRRLLLDRLHIALVSSSRSGHEGALLFIDLDNFKTINDTLGHYTGDLLLQQVAQRIQHSVREGDTVARLGGDEFVVMLEGLSEHNLEAAAQAKAAGEKILVSLNQPYNLANHEHRNTPSIGVTLFNNRQQSVDELMKQADIAMYQAKKAGRNTLVFFDPNMQEAINTRSIREIELRNALLKKQFKLLYQLQVDSELRPLGAELLIRWIHPDLGQISPAEFIPLAEEVGLIYSIGWWVFETACAQIKAWEQDVKYRNLVLSVNVSAKQLHHADFTDQVKAAVEHYEINPRLLKLELTESMLLDDIDIIISTMWSLRDIGIEFSLDDFGTGYSSLQYLKKLPLSQLKIDQSFVSDIAYDNSDKTIVRTIIAMAQSLNLSVIAEGVETEEQRQLLLNSGCIHYQGYLFSKPVPIDEFEALIEKS